MFLKRNKVDGFQKCKTVVCWTSKFYIELIAALNFLNVVLVCGNKNMNFISKLELNLVGGE